MAEGKKISQLPVATELTGAERLPFALNNNNGAATTELLKEYAQQGMVAAVEGKGLSTKDYSAADKNKLDALPTNAQLTETLGGKLDKSVWNERNEQFGFDGGYYLNNGNTHTSQVYKRTGLIPLNNDFDLIYKGLANANTASIVFFDCDKSFISSVQFSSYSERIIQKSEIPINAVYFAASSIKTLKSYYSNGITVEAREGATADAIERASALVPLINRAKAAGATYNKSTGFFELNGLTDITTTELENILVYGMLIPPYYRGMNNSTLRTTIVCGYSDIGADLSNLCGNLPNMVVLALQKDDNKQCIISKANYFLSSAPNLIRIIGKLNMANCSNYTEMFYGNIPLLADVKLFKVNKNLNLSKLKSISYESVYYLVNNAANTSPITITVHPDVYAKLSGDTENEAAAALSAEELAQWTALVETAAAKQIQFVTTE